MYLAWLLAVLISGTWFGMSLSYLTMAVPASKECSAADELARIWRGLYENGKLGALASTPILVVLGFLAMSSKTCHMCLWLAILFILVKIPFTFIKMEPGINKELKEATKKKSTKEVLELMATWCNYHAVRAATDGLSFLFFAMAWEGK